MPCLQAGDADLTVANANSVWVDARYELQPAYSQVGRPCCLALTARAARRLTGSQATKPTAATSHVWGWLVAGGCVPCARLPMLPLLLATEAQLGQCSHSNSRPFFPPMPTLLQTLAKFFDAKVDNITTADVSMPRGWLHDKEIIA